MKSKNSKSGNYLKFFGIILIAGMIGGIAGFTSSIFEKDMADTARLLGNYLMVSAPYILIVLGIAGSMLNAYLVWKAKRDMMRLDQEDEEEAERIERFNNRSQGIISDMVILNLVVGMIFLSGRYKIHGTNGIFLAGMLIFIVYALWCAVAMNMLVENLKKLNPEKRGNALSFRFDKEWLKSCDEREKARIYEAAYRVYARSTYLYSGLLIFFIVISVAVDIGVLPFLTVGCIWIFQNVTYYRSYGKIK